MAYKEYDAKTLKKVHDVELEILDEFVKVCKKNKLRYFLVGGTLLGAVRHKGFIPWDDDIDVGMPRSDYDKFIKIAKEELDNNYFIESFENNNNYSLPFAKVMKKNTIFLESVKNNVNGGNGIFIDIFPFENITNNGLNYKIRYAFSYAIVDAVFYKNKLRALNKTMYPVLTLFFGMFSKKRLNKILHFIMTRSKDDNSKYLSVLGAGYGFRKELMLRKDVLPTKEIEFEGRKYNGMANNDAYLSSLYGDYMKLPPVEKRTNHMPEKIVFDIIEEEKYANADLRKLQKTLQEILDDFVKICNHHHLEYFLVGGTALGAVRHAGFIPWDDDMDVAMPRDDYEKFLEIAREELDKKYFLDYYKTNGDNHFGFAKIRKNNTTFVCGYDYACHNGFFFDIFPIDYNVNRDSIKTKLSASLSRCLLETLKYKDHNLPKIKSLRRPFISLLFVPFSNYRIHKMVDALYTCQNKSKRVNGAIYSGSYYYKKDIYPLDKVFPYSEVEFEGKKYHIFHDPDYYLKGLYGNYMELPPVEKRFAHKPEKLDFNHGDVKNTKEEYNKLNRK